MRASRARMLRSMRRISFWKAGSAVTRSTERRTVSSTTCWSCPWRSATCVSSCTRRPARSGTERIASMPRTTVGESPCSAATPCWMISRSTRSDSGPLFRSEGGERGHALDRAAHGVVDHVLELPEALGHLRELLHAAAGPLGHRANRLHAAIDGGGEPLQRRLAVLDDLA